MSKTIKEWLETIEDSEIREQALKSYDGEIEIAYNLQDAIGRAFYWELSPEGRSYWDDIHTKAVNGTLATIQPSPSQPEAILFMKWMSEGGYLANWYRAYNGVDTIEKWYEQFKNRQ